MISLPVPSKLITRIAFTLIAIWGCFFAFVCFAAVCSFLTQPSSSIATMGQMGDTFGIFNALVSSLAFAGTAYALMLQVNALQQSEKHHLEVAERTRIETQIGKLERLAFSLRRLCETISNVQIEMLSPSDSSALELRQKILFATSEPELLVYFYLQEFKDDCSKIQTLTKNFMPLIEKGFMAELVESGNEIVRKTNELVAKAQVKAVELSSKL